jgi:hypothetical protein
VKLQEIVILAYCFMLAFYQMGKMFFFCGPMGFIAMHKNIEVLCLLFIKWKNVFSSGGLWVSSLAYPNLLGTRRLGCC